MWIDIDIIYLSAKIEFFGIADIATAKCQATVEFWPLATRQISVAIYQKIPHSRILNEYQSDAVRKSWRRVTSLLCVLSAQAQRGAAVQGGVF
jgi:hypothetical protein